MFLIYFFIIFCACIFVHGDNKNSIRCETNSDCLQSEKIFTFLYLEGRIYVHRAGIYLKNFCFLKKLFKTIFVFQGFGEVCYENSGLNSCNEGFLCSSPRCRCMGNFKYNKTTKKCALQYLFIYLFNLLFRLHFFLHFILHIKNLFKTIYL